MALVVSRTLKFYSVGEALSLKYCLLVELSVINESLEDEAVCVALFSLHDDAKQCSKSTQLTHQQRIHLCTLLQTALTLRHTEQRIRTLEAANA